MTDEKKLSTDKSDSEELPKITDAPRLASGDEQADKPGGPLKILSRLYRWLYMVEIALLIFFLVAAVILAFSLVVIERFKLGSASWMQPVVYHFTFYLGLVGGVIATRQSEHISIDVLSRFLKNPRAKHFLRFVIFIFGIYVTWVLVDASVGYIKTVIQPDDMLVKTQVGWMWNRRLWKTPYVFCFGLMMFHFAVNAVRSLVWGIQGKPIQEELRVH